MVEPEWVYACHRRHRQRGWKRPRDDAASGTGSRPFTRIGRWARGLRIAAGSRRGLRRRCMRAVITVLCISAVSASAVGAQTASTIDPGMTREEVVATIGQPLSTRSYQGFTYLLYKNGCEKKCGMNDLVVLDSGKVVDAVFRSPSRWYSGKSSSPRMI